MFQFGAARWPSSDPYLLIACAFSSYCADVGTVGPRSDEPTGLLNLLTDLFAY